ncbi:MAG: acetyl-CoA carboxylase biotin carboxyl carrier protein [Vicinamibacteria bacterium]
MELEILKTVLSMIEGTDVVEVELEAAGKKVRVRRYDAARVSPAAPVPAPVAAPQAAPPVAVAAVAVAALPVVDPSHHQMKSPIVGTYYSASDPTAPPFVKVGDTVRKGQVLCIIEAMKLMNEIEADVAGEILKVHAENGHPVQFGEPLFTIKTA